MKNKLNFALLALIGSLTMGTTYFICTPLKGPPPGPSSPLRTGEDGTLTVAPGETVTITAGDIKKYASVTVSTGGTLQIAKGAVWTQIGVQNDLTVNGTIVCEGVEGSSQTISTTALDGRSLSHTITQNLGGSGGNTPAWTDGCGIGVSGRSGGAQNDGFGGGGASGGASFFCGPVAGVDGAAGQASASSGGGVSGGNGGAYNTAGGNGGTGSGVGSSGTGGGGAGGGNAGSGGIGGGGGGGGGKGRHGGLLYLSVGGNIVGSGTINCAGKNGGNGGNGSTGASTQHQGGSGGGGAAGGDGGHVVVAQPSGANSVPVSVTGGTKGTGGTGATGDVSGGGPATGGNGSDGQNGDAGTYTLDAA